MRIAYIINSLEGGGAAFPIPIILTLMHKLGAEVRVFALTLKDGKALDPIQKAEIPVFIRSGDLNDHWQAYRWLDKQVINYQPTHLWTSLTRATLLGQLIGYKHNLPVISWQHAAYLKFTNLKLLQLTRNLTKLWLGDSDIVTQLTIKRLGISNEHIITWPIFRATPDQKRATPWHHGEKVKIISMGRLHKVKGYDILIQAIRILKNEPNLPPFEVSIYGEGKEYNFLNCLIKQYQLRDCFYLKGFTNQVSDKLTDQHLYLQPSRSEGFCVSAHEAMQVGLPVIASAVGELPHSIENNVSGLTVAPGDPFALAAALGQLLQKPENLYHMGTCAREKIFSCFSEERFNQIGKHIYERMEKFST